MLMLEDHDGAIGPTQDLIRRCSSSVLQAGVIEGLLEATNTEEDEALSNASILRLGPLI
jgi:hypothetical protein